MILIMAAEYNKIELALVASENLKGKSVHKLSIFVGGKKDPVGEVDNHEFSVNVIQTDHTTPFYNVTIENASNTTENRSIVIKAKYTAESEEVEIVSIPDYNDVTEDGTEDEKGNMFALVGDLDDTRTILAHLTYIGEPVNNGDEHREDNNGDEHSGENHETEGTPTPSDPATNGATSGAPSEPKEKEPVDPVPTPAPKRKITLKLIPDSFTFEDVVIKSIEGDYTYDSTEWLVVGNEGEPYKFSYTLKDREQFVKPSEIAKIIFKNGYSFSNFR